jgi:hypothetical protein
MLNFETSTSPLSVIFNFGMTGNARNERVIKGSLKDVPNAAVAPIRGAPPHFFYCPYDIIYVF